jgi:hypothetical protein
VGRNRKNPPPDDWKKKLYPVFFELAELNREFEKRWAALQDEWKRDLGSAGPRRTAKPQDAARVARDLSKLQHWYDERLFDIDRRYKPISYNPVAYGYFTLDAPFSDAKGIREYVHFHRHGEALRVTQDKDAQGDIRAWDKIARTERDIRILSFSLFLQRANKTLSGRCGPPPTTTTGNLL